MTWPSVLGVNPTPSSTAPGSPASGIAGTAELEKSEHGHDATLAVVNCHEYGVMTVPDRAVAPLTVAV